MNEASFLRAILVGHIKLVSFKNESAPNDFGKINKKDGVRWRSLKKSGT